MKMSINATSNMRDILEHTKSVTLGVSPSTTHIIWDDIYPIPLELRDRNHMNNSASIAKLLQNPEAYETFKTVFNITKGQTAFHLYGFIGPNGVGDLIEISAKHRFMVGDCGPIVPFVQCAGIACDSTIYDALPTLVGLLNGIQEIGYCGELLISCTESFEICDITFGHNVAGFALVCEMSKQNPQSFFEFCFGLTPTYALHTDRIAINTLLSYPPFPANTDTPFTILAPPSSEKHLYRFSIGRNELAYVCTWGLYVQEAKRRCRRTIDSCRNYYDLLQYRVDYGYKDKFYIMSDLYGRLGG